MQFETQVNWTVALEVSLQHSNPSLQGTFIIPSKPAKQLCTGVQIVDIQQPHLRRQLKPSKNKICVPYMTGSYFYSSSYSRLDSANHESPSLENPSKHSSGSFSWVCTLREYYFKSTLREPRVTREPRCGHRYCTVKTCTIQQKLRSQTKIFCLDSQIHTVFIQ
jgi:hypothetical protein